MRKQKQQQPYSAIAWKVWLQLRLSMDCGESSGGCGVSTLGPARRPRVTPTCSGGAAWSWSHKPPQPPSARGGRFGKYNVEWSCHLTQGPRSITKKNNSSLYPSVNLHRPRASLWLYVHTENELSLLLVHRGTLYQSWGSLQNEFLLQLYFALNSDFLFPSVDSLLRVSNKQSICFKNVIYNLYVFWHVMKFYFHPDTFKLYNPY